MFKDVSPYQYIVLGAIILLDVMVYFKTGQLHEGITGALIGAMVTTAKGKEA